jgi:hypothetical protein
VPHFAQKRALASLTAPHAAQRAGVFRRRFKTTRTIASTTTAPMPPRMIFSQREAAGAAYGRDVESATFRCVHDRIAARFPGGVLVDTTGKLSVSWR